MKNLIYIILRRLLLFYNEETRKRKFEKFNLIQVRVEDGYLDGNIEIGEKTYINHNFRIVSGTVSKVTIGEHCAIGRNFTCASRTHDIKRPTSDRYFSQHLITEKNISIGNGVWIGDNVIVREGVTIDDYAIIGGNSIVVKNVKRFEIVGGVPAIHIRYNTEHHLYTSSEESR